MNTYYESPDRPEAPLVTVVMAVLNGVGTVGQALRSIEGQTLGGIELVVMDGGSTDGTLDVLRGHGGAVSYLRSGQDGGIYAALNAGIRAARGEYVYVLGCDDWLYGPCALEGAAQWLGEGVDVLSGCVWEVGADGMQRLFLNNIGRSRDEDLQLMSISSPHQGMLVRTDVMRRHPFDERYRLAADYKLLLELWGDGDVGILKIPDIIAYYSGTGTSGQCTTERLSETREILREAGLPDVFSPPGVVERVCGHVRSVCARTLGFGGRQGSTVLVPHRCVWDGCRYCGGTR